LGASLNCRLYLGKKRAVEKACIRGYCPAKIGQVAQQCARIAGFAQVPHPQYAFLGGRNQKKFPGRIFDILRSFRKYLQYVVVGDCLKIEDVGKKGIFGTIDDCFFRNRVVDYRNLVQ
jgi:hypothetical protein